MKRSAAKTIISILANLSAMGLNACVVAVPIISVWCSCAMCSRHHVGPFVSNMLKLDYITRQEKSQPCLQTSPVYTGCEAFQWAAACSMFFTPWVMSASTRFNFMFHSSQLAREFCDDSQEWLSWTSRFPKNSCYLSLKAIYWEHLEKHVAHHASKHFL